MSNKYIITAILLSGGALWTMTSHAAISLDRTRVIVDGGDKSLSLNVSNDNKSLPYLAQAWLEDATGNKVNSPMVILPPIQRIEAGAKSQVKIQLLPETKSLPQDRESLYYFNLREIPPRSSKANTLQIALQTRVKLFYRPDALKLSKTEAAHGDWVKNITLQRDGNSWVIHNDSAYYFTAITVQKTVQSKPENHFSPVMVAPKSREKINIPAAELGNTPVIAYINDYGGRPRLRFDCSGSVCHSEAVKEK